MTSWMTAAIALAFCLAVRAAWAQSGDMPNPGRLIPGAVIPSAVTGAAVSSVGPGDTLFLTVFGQSALSAQVTVNVEGAITVPFLGELSVAGMAPTAIGRRIAKGLQEEGYLQDPQVSVEVIRVRSRVASILGEVAKPGRYPIEGRLTLLELLAMAGGLKETAGYTAVVLRRNADGTSETLRVELPTLKHAESAVADFELRADDVVTITEMPKFYVYGEVLRAGAYPMEPDLNVMRALSIAGGMTQRGSEKRIEVRRVDRSTGELVKIRVPLVEKILPGDVVHVNERFF